MNQQQQPAPEPGVYENVDFADYLAWPYVNNSSLSYAARSMHHYRYSPNITPTDAMRLGSLTHCGRLEPAALHARYAVMPDFTEDLRKPDGSQYSNPRASKEYKERVAQWQAQQGEREIVTREDMDRMLGMVSAITLHERARNWMCGPGPAELSVVWDDPGSGVRCKARVDKVSHNLGLAVDLKTTRDASEFENAVARYKYHRQAAFYLDGLREATRTLVGFAIVCVESTEPYGVRAAVMSADALDLGREEYTELLNGIADCRESGQWPGYDSPDAWDLPGWYKARHEQQPAGLTLNGEVVL